LRKAQQAGVEIIEGEEVISFDLYKNEITTSREKVLKARFIIGADGVNSILRRSLPLEQFDQHKWQHNLATAMEIFVNPSEIRKEVNHPILFFGFIKWGYSWIFPNRDKLIVGICGLNRENKRLFLSSFYNFLSAVGLKLKNLKIAGHPLPYGNFLLRPVYRKTMLIGDAAGFTDPLLGEGIFYAQRSAELASQALYKSVYEGENLERVYPQLLQKYMYPGLIHARRIRWLIFNGFSRFQYYPLKALLYMLREKPGETVHGIRSYKWLRKAG
jgi:flavin-dependent dehydrogenase